MLTVTTEVQKSCTFATLRNTSLWVSPRWVSISPRWPFSNFLPASMLQHIIVESAILADMISATVRLTHRFYGAVAYKIAGSDTMAPLSTGVLSNVTWPGGLLVHIAEYKFAVVKQTLLKKCWKIHQGVKHSTHTSRIKICCYRYLGRKK